MRHATADHVLIVGGRPAAALACARQLGQAGHRVSTLRWTPQRSAADASRHCECALWLGYAESGVSRWRHELERMLGDAKRTAVLPADPLAHALLCDGGISLPDGARLLGPTAFAYAKGSDRLQVFNEARSAGWGVAHWWHAVDPGFVCGTPPPCIVRPRWEFRIVEDQLARFTTKHVADADALDAKLRDDVPRGEVLVQTRPPLRVERLAAVALAGRVVGFWLSPASADQAREDASLRERTQALVARLGWTGMLEIEFAFVEGAPTLLDFRCGSAEAFVQASRAGIALAAALLPPATGQSRIVASRLYRPRVADPLPSIAAAAIAVREIGVKVLRRTRATLWLLARFVEPSLQISPTTPVLLVCKGNINRSLVAEQLLRAAGYGSVESAALVGLDGRRASRWAEQFLRDTVGTAPGTIRSQSLQRAMSRGSRFELVLCFERRQAVELGDRYPQLRGRIGLFRDLAPMLDGPLDIADPHGRSQAEHHRCFTRIRLIVQAATATVPGLQPAVGRVH